MAGQIIKRGDNTWLVRIFTGKNAKGKRSYLNKTIHGVRKDAQHYLNQKLRERDLGISLESSTITVDEFIDRWLESAVRPRVSPRTADGYESRLEKYIRTPLGSKRLEALTAMDIQYVYAQIQAQGLSARTVRHTHSALHNALKQAVRWNLLQKNVAEYVELPKVPHIERRVLSPEESKRFLDKAETMPHGLIFEFALLSGMRPEESLALQWSDLDFERCTAQVNRALVRHKGSWTFEKPKTAKSRRIITLSEPLMLKLKVHKRSQNETRLKNGLHWENNNLVFCTDLGTPHSVPNLTYRYYRPILTKAGLPQIRLYDLRHSHATLLLIAEENPKVVAERLGHSTIVLTMDTYSHVIPTMQRNATDKLTKMLYERPKKPVEKRLGTL
ncbi:MAG: tyrosine-type recombinase/integrase [Pyrinomonadaceae bacterium]